MRKHVFTIIYGLLPLWLIWSGPVWGDTFTAKDSSERFTGYATGKKVNGKWEVVTAGAKKNIDPVKYDVEYDHKGRKSIVPVIELHSEIGLEMEVEAVEQAIEQESAKGPLFIVLEIDSPGGRVDLAKRMCSKILAAEQCPIVAYIISGEHGGALSAAAALSLSCDKIYMSPQAVIGAATVITVDEEGHATDVNEAMGEDIGEKISSAWRNYLAGLAQAANRPGALAKAMEDKDIAVVEINREGKREFVEMHVVTMITGAKIVKTWSKAGSLLTLTASDSVTTGMADGTARNLPELLSKMDAESAKITRNRDATEAREKYDMIISKLNELGSALDGSFKKLAAGTTMHTHMKGTRQIIKDLKLMMNIKKRFGEDVPIDEQRLMEAINDATAYYESLQEMRRR